MIKGLFTRREGYPCATDTLASGLKLALVYKQVTLAITRVNFTSFATCFVMRYILCNGQRFEIILQFSMENTLNS